MTDPTSSEVTSLTEEEKALQARWRADGLAKERYHKEQARRWKIMHQRPPSVLIASISLTLSGSIALGTAPFISMHEGMYGAFPLIGRSIVFPAVSLGLLALPLGVMLGRARNWARWIVALLGPALTGFLVYEAYPDPTWLALAPATAWIVYMLLLFNAEANRFFR